MEEQLQELSIFALRELARRTGVNSPTSKTKQQMINDIIAIKNGVKKPHIPKTKQGRPPKSFGYDFSNIFADKNQIAPAFSKSVTLNQDVEEFKNVSSCEVEGIVEVVSNNVGFVWVNNLQDYDCYFIPSGTIHAIGKGVTILEIQQNSNLTYRLFDYNRLDKNGNAKYYNEQIYSDVDRRK